MVVVDGRIKYRQAKNEYRNPIDMDIPLHPDFANVISATPSGHLTYLERIPVMSMHSQHG